METIKALGIAGFLFFLIKGLAWLVVFRLAAKGILSKDRVDRLKKRWRKPGKKKTGPNETD